MCVCVHLCEHTHKCTLDTYIVPAQTYTHTHTHILGIHLSRTRPMSVMRTVLYAALQASLLGQLEQLVNWNHYTGLAQCAA